MSKELVIKNHIFSGEKPTICVPVVASSDAAILESIEKCIAAGVELIEFRADYYENLLDIEKLLLLVKKISALCKDTAVLFTIRTKAEGGEIDISEEDYKKILLAISHDHHIDLVDCELDKVSDFGQFVSSLQDEGVKVVASHHNFAYTYPKAEIINIYERMLAGGADIQKIAMMPKSKEDALLLMSSAIDFNDKHEDSLLVAISMGELGQITRICSGYINSCITFATIENSSAPGQISYENMKEIYSKVLHTIRGE